MPMLHDLHDDLHALATELRTQASRYRSLALAVDSERVCELALTMASSLDARAAEIERETGSEIRYFRPYAA